LYKLLKPVLFLLPPERVHYATVFLLKTALKIPFSKRIFTRLFVVKDKSLEREVFGLRFPNPVGLAAGFDKNGKCFEEMSYLGFGFVELGTVTPKPQDGNPQPRLFRLPQSQALINRMGFNNDGVDALAERLQKAKATGRMGNAIIGGNIGKNKTTPNELAIADYEYCFERLFDHVDYFVVNVSSPNTPDLRALQEKEPLKALLSRLQSLNRQKPAPKPILLKIAPDLTNGQLDDILEIVQSTGVSGVVATNTTISRSNLLESETSIREIGAGGLSGKPVTRRSTEVIRYLTEKSGGSLDIIGVGGIDSAESAMEKSEAGAKLVQIYTGLIYVGPTLPKLICENMIR